MRAGETRQGRRSARWRFGVLTALALGAFGLAGCSDTSTVGNPVGWARGLVGLQPGNSATDNAPTNQALKEGGKEPYPNLASVPEPPVTTMTRIDRDKLAQSLIADRRNAAYTAEELRPGDVMSAAPPPSAGTGAQPPKPVATAPLRSPTIANLPKGEMPKAPPPAPPGIRNDQKLSANLPAAAARSRIARPPRLVAEIREGPRGDIPRADKAALARIARRAVRERARVRIVGHGATAKAGDLAERKFQSFDAALDYAKTVAVALTQLGVPADRIDVETAANMGSSGRADIYLID
jgi:hypothetical protein